MKWSKVCAGEYASGDYCIVRAYTRTYGKNSWNLKHPRMNVPLKFPSLRQAKKAAERHASNLPS
jgi:hypothetical protein